MWVDFFRGIVRGSAGEQLPAHWARTPFGGMALLSGTDLVALEAISEVVSEQCITSLDLSGVDREGCDNIVAAILTGGYLEKPGVEGKGEAILFVLVNEAIHSMEEAAREEASEEGEGGTEAEGEGAQEAEGGGGPPTKPE